jgi:hypothetical protein
MVLDITSVNPRERIAGMFLEQLSYPLGADERIEIRHKLPGDNKLMRQRFFCDAVQAARYVIELDGEDVYVGAAPRYGSDGSKAGVRRTNALWTDLDFKDGHTRESRLEQLQELPHHPSILVWTGGGWHPYFLLKKPAEGPEELARAEYVMGRIAEGLQGDPVHDRSRILRVPGTFNSKYGEPRPVVMEHYYPDLRHGLEELGQMAEALPRKVSDDPDYGGAVQRDVLRGPIREGTRNVALASVAGSLRNRGLDPETICSVLLGVNQHRCEPPLAETEVVDIGRSIGHYPPGRPRYRKSSAVRVYTNRKVSS